MNILKEADRIVNERAQEKERMYGPFSEGMERAAKILEGMTGKPISAELMYKAMVALKLSRESYSHKQDNLLDAIAYLGAMNNYIEEK
jgi:DNA-binding protein H-NS